MTIRTAFEMTLLEILRKRDLAAVAILSVLFYAFYYPAPYSTQVVERLPIAVVDLDHSAASRATLNLLHAADAVTVVARPSDLSAARRLMRTRDVEGVLIIPRGFGTLSAPARPGVGIALWLNGAYLLRAEAVGKSVAEAVAATVDLHFATSADERKIRPAAIAAHPLFNTTQGYRDYVFPAIANVILQQTLLFAVARLVAERRRLNRWVGGIRPLIGVWAAATTIGTLAGLLYFGLVFWLQDIPHGGNIPALLFTVPLFAATVSGLAITIGCHVRSGDAALKLLLPTSIPIVFLTGFAWPLAAMPGWVRAVAWTIPATPATHIFVPLNQMGASLGEVAPAVLILLAQCVVFATTAIAGSTLPATARRGDSATRLG